MPQLSPGAAYRADLAGRATPFGADDDRWLQAATSLHAAAAQKDKSNTDPLYDAIGVALDVLGEDSIDARVAREWLGDHIYIEALVFLAEDVQWAGALRLSGVMLDDLLRAAPDVDPLHRGRILALRARTDWKLGLADEAAERYEFIAALGREVESNELLARAELGLSTIASLRGNMPAVRQHSERVVQLAESATPPHDRLAAVGYWGLMMVDSKAGRMDDAIGWTWKALAHTKNDPSLKAFTLHNLGQILLDNKYWALARAALSAVMPLVAPARVLIPALGGLALAAARTDARNVVDWATREAWRADSGGIAYERSEALLECALALRIVGRRDDAARYMDAARRLAEENRFNEIAFRVEAAQRDEHVVTEEPRMPPAERVAREVAALEPERLPATVRMEAATA